MPKPCHYTSRKLKLPFGPILLQPKTCNRHNEPIHVLSSAEAGDKIGRCSPTEIKAAGAPSFLEDVTARPPLANELHQTFVRHSLFRFLSLRLSLRKLECQIRNRNWCSDVRTAGNETSQDAGRIAQLSRRARAYVTKAFRRRKAERTRNARSGTLSRGATHAHSG